MSKRQSLISWFSSNRRVVVYLENVWKNDIDIINDCWYILDIIEVIYYNRMDRQLYEFRLNEIVHMIMMIRNVVQSTWMMYWMHWCNVSVTLEHNVKYEVNLNNVIIWNRSTM